MRPMAPRPRMWLRRPAFLSATALVGSLMPAAAFAAEAKEGMPQLDVHHPLFVSHIVWLVIIFAVLYRLLSSWALPKVGEVLEMRAARIAEDLDAAREAKTEADGAVAELTQATREAQASAQAEIGAAVSAAKAEAASQSAVLNARLDAQIAEADSRIAAARSAALGALRQVATDTAATVVTRLTGSEPDSFTVDNAVGAALAARGHA